MEMNQVTESQQSEDEEETDTKQTGDVDDEEMMSEQLSDVDFDINSQSYCDSASAILNIIKNSPVKKRGAKYLMSNKLNKFTDEEKLDILVVLAHSVSDDIKTLLKEKGIDIISIPRKTKRTSFSDLSRPNTGTKMS